MRKLFETDPWRDWHTTAAGGLCLALLAMVWRMVRGVHENIMLMTGACGGMLLLTGVVSCWEYYNVPSMPGGNKDEEGAVWNRVGVALLAPLWLRAVAHTAFDVATGRLRRGEASVA